MDLDADPEHQEVDERVQAAAGELNRAEPHPGETTVASVAYKPPDRSISILEGGTRSA
jgi:hypothetical protein